MKDNTALVGIDAIVDFTGRPWNVIKKWIANDNFPAKKRDGRWESDTVLINDHRRQQIIGVSGK